MRIPLLRATLVAQLVTNPPAMRETWVRSLGWEDPLEEGMATHSCILAWGIHGQRSLVNYNLWGRKESRHDSAAKHSTAYLYRMEEITFFISRPAHTQT